MGSQFNSDSASEAGRKSKRGKATTLDIDTMDGAELVVNSLRGDYGAVVQKQVLLLVVQHQLKASDRKSKQTIDEETLVSSAYLKHLSRTDLETLMEEKNAINSQQN